MAWLPALCFGCSYDEVFGHNGYVIAVQLCQSLHTLVIGYQKLAISRGLDMIPQRRTRLDFFYKERKLKEIVQNNAIASHGMIRKPVCSSRHQDSKNRCCHPVWSILLALLLVDFKYSNAHSWLLIGDEEGKKDASTSQITELELCLWASV